jgi:hypothetical protein
LAVLLAGDRLQRTIEQHALKERLRAHLAR